MRTTQTKHLRARTNPVRVFALILAALSITTTQAQEIDPSDIPGLDNFVNPDFINCLQQDDPETCLRSRFQGGTGGSTSSPGKNQGVLSVVEQDYGNPFDLNLPPALDVFFGDLTNLPPAIHLMHEDAYQHCIEEVHKTDMMLHECAETWGGLTIAVPDENYDKFKDDVNTAWAQFNTRMIEDLHRAINTGPPCVSPPRLICSLLWLLPQTPVPDYVCAAGKVAAEYPRAFARHYPELWVAILEATAKHLPNTVAYGLTLNPIDPLPGGSLIAPIADMSVVNLIEDFSLDALGIPLNPLDLLDPAFAASLTEDARQNLYYHEALIAQIYRVIVSTPILPGDIVEGRIGIAAFEDNKTLLETATGIHYENIGYAVFSQLTAPMELHTFFELRFAVPFNRPSIEVRCLEGGINTGVSFPVPVPAMLARPYVNLISVPEGGVIPNTAGDLLTVF